MINGVVLFADDQVHNDSVAEFELYKLFRGEYIVLPVDNLDHLEQALLSVSTFDVIILDWEFLSHDADFAGLPPQNPMSILERLKLFSKIFVYSSAVIPAASQARLHELFPGRVAFKSKVFQKDDVEALVAEFAEIKKELENFAQSNKNLDFSVAWSRAINQSLQSIFNELASVNKHWLREVYQSSVTDNSSPAQEIISLLNNLLAEQLLQNADLQAVITTLGQEEPATGTTESEAATLFQRMYYTRIHDAAVPFATGDILDISADEYAILITPECEVYEHASAPPALKSNLEILCIHKSDLFKDFGKKQDLDKFNQNAAAKHFLPSFPYLDEPLLMPASIHFLKALRTVPREYLTQHSRRYKLNAPYIQQLRQRYSAWHNRVGVPAVNDLIKKFNNTQVATLKAQQEAAAAAARKAAKQAGKGQEPGQLATPSPDENPAE